MAKSKGPVSYRLDDAHRELLRYLCYVKDASDSRVVQRGLRAYARTTAKNMLQEGGENVSEELALLVKRLNAAAKRGYSVAWADRKLVLQGAGETDKDDTDDDDESPETPAE